MNKTNNDPVLNCPWFNLGRNALCTCKEYTKNLSVLVLVDQSCPQHGFEQVVDKCNQDIHNG